MAKKILLIDDSALMRRVISDIINSGGDYEVADIARDGVEGFEKIVSNPSLYDAIIMDINMPRMNGIELLRELHNNHIEQTVIVVSTVAKEGAKETIQALEYGAFDFVTKPENYFETKGEAFRNQIHAMLDAATSSRPSAAKAAQAPARPVRTTIHQPAGTTVSGASRPASRIATSPATSRVGTPDSVIRPDEGRAKGVKSGRKKLVALACSTGGPKSLQQVIPYLPENLDAGVVLVQHMPKGFTSSRAQRLNELSHVTVKEAEEGDVIRKGWVYIAPGGRHIRVDSKGTDYVIRLSDEDPVEGLRPCANIMYDSLTKSRFDEITCVVLTGMGADGTKGIKNLKDAGRPIHVIGQDEQSCVVYGMPKALAQAGLTDEVVPLNQIADAITKNVGVL